MKKYSIITVALFLALIVFFTSFSVFGKKSDFSVKENRALQTYPEVSFETIGDGSFQEQYDAFLSDQFEFRDFWVKARTDIMLALGKKDINGVYFGKDGYLIEKYQESDYDSDSVLTNIDYLNDFLGRTAEKGYDIRVAFIPSKAGVLKACLPKNAAPYDTSQIPEGLKENINKKVGYTDLYKTLSEHENEYIYYKTDHHWTSLGAYYAYEKLMQDMKLTPVKADVFKKTEVSTDFFGSTYDKVQVETAPDVITRYDSDIKVSVDYHGDSDNTFSLYNGSYLKEKNKYDYFLGGNYARVDVETSAKTDETLVLIKDSYANSMLPFLVNSFKHITMIDLRFFTGDVSETLDGIKPSKVLVLYNTEKFMSDQNQVKLEEPGGEGASDTGDTAEDEAILAELEAEEQAENDE